MNSTISTVPDLQIDKLNAVKEYITKEYERFDMAHWAKKYISPSLFGRFIQRFRGISCNTVCCIAGATCLLEGLDPIKIYNEQEFTGVDEPNSVAGRAAVILGLTEEEAYKLFWPGYWPHEYQVKLAHADRKEEARLACEMIDNIIAQRAENSWQTELTISEEVLAETEEVETVTV